MKTRRCHVCKCTETNACPGRCWWIGEDLCSSCGTLAARHLKERVPSGPPKKFWWTRHVDIEMGFVRWSLRYCVNGQLFGEDLHLCIIDIKVMGRFAVAHQLRKVRFLQRIRLADLADANRERSYAT